MLYTITITNKNIDYTSPGIDIIDLATISPSPFMTPRTSYDEYADDMAYKDKSVTIPLYKRMQCVTLKPSSALVIQTEDSDEAVYYREMGLSNVSILCDPDPISGGTSIVQSLKDLYVALGGAEQDVEDANSIVDVLNAISVMYEGETSTTIAGAIEEIAAVADNIGGGGASISKALFGTSKYNTSSQSFIGAYTPTTLLVDDTGVYRIEASTTSNSFTLGTPAKSISLSFNNGTVAFTPAADFSGFTNHQYPNAQIVMSGDTIVPGDGKGYGARWDTVTTPSGVTTTVIIKKTVIDFVYEAE